MSSEWIVLEGCRENNLRQVSLRIPKGKITVFAGVSGSGKSSIVFDTIAQEAGRQLNETYSNFVRLFLPRYSQPDADSIAHLSPAIVVDQSRIGGNARSTLGTVTDINPLLRLLFSRFGDPHVGYGNAFSFNDPNGMCPTCEGIGHTVTFDIEKALDMDKSLNEGAILLPGYGPGTIMWKMYAHTGFFDLDRKLSDYSAEEMEKLVNAPSEMVSVPYRDGTVNTAYEGLAVKLLRQNTKTEKERSKKSQESFERFTTMAVCPACEGKRYSQRALSSKIMGLSIYDMTAMQPNELITTLQAYDAPGAEVIVKSLVQRLQNLIDIGLDYMSLTRETTTLSGGESQRVKMVKHLSSSLTGMLYIFDEPSIGLHPSDVHRLNEMLVRLRDEGNTVLVVEHDPDVIRIADHVIEMGPGAGSHGGSVVFAGSYQALCRADTLTSKYLGRRLTLKEHVRAATEAYESQRSSLHNLRDVRLRIPKGVFTAITGVAGSGKSTLVNAVFAKDYPDAIRIDQSPVGANIRSNPATYTGIMDAIRKLFAEANGVSAALFSHNSEGACEVCRGTGKVEINLSFMDKLEVVCEACGGKRYKPEALMHRLEGMTITEVMEKTVEEAMALFTGRDILGKLQSLMTVGLGYMTLGQPLNTLSGGECQRLKLAKELSRKGNIYILDEPTTGLHMSDIEHILAIINKLVDRGNTVVAIEHNLDIIRNADWIVDMGPDGGRKGGEILFEGTPQQLLGCAASRTAQYLLA